MQATEAVDRPRTMFGHVLGLPIMIALKVWEIFSYQGMRAFLIFYLIAPLTYSAAGRTVPRHLQGVVTGLLLLSFAFGNLCAGWLVALAAIPAGTAASDTATIYGRYFTIMAGIGGIAAVFSLVLGRIFGPGPDQAIPSSSGKVKALVMPASIEK